MDSIERLVRRNAFEPSRLFATPRSADGVQPGRGAGASRPAGRLRLVGAEGGLLRRAFEVAAADRVRHPAASGRATRCGWSTGSSASPGTSTISTRSNMPSPSSTRSWRPRACTRSRPRCSTPRRDRAAAGPVREICRARLLARPEGLGRVPDHGAAGGPDAGLRLGGLAPSGLLPCAAATGGHPRRGLEALMTNHLDVDDVPGIDVPTIDVADLENTEADAADLGPGRPGGWGRRGAAPAPARAGVGPDRGVRPALCTSSAPAARWAPRSTTPPTGCPISRPCSPTWPGPMASTRRTTARCRCPAPEAEEVKRVFRHHANVKRRAIMNPEQRTAVVAYLDALLIEVNSCLELDEHAPSATLGARGAPLRRRFPRGARGGGGAVGRVPQEQYSRKPFSSNATRAGRGTGCCGRPRVK